MRTNNNGTSKSDKIAILRCYTPEYKELHEKTWPSVEKYAALHKGIDIFPIEIPPHTNDSPAPWHKMQSIRDALVWYDYVLWIDADAYIQNMDTPLSKFFEPEYDVFISKDINGINAGVMGFASSAGAFVKAVLNKPMLAPWFEQGIMQDLIAAEFPVRIKYLNQAEFQAYRYELYDMEFPQGQATPESFIIHLPGLTNEKRIESLPLQY